MKTAPGSAPEAHGTRRRAALAVLAIVSFVGLAHALHLPLCPTRALFGIPCAGCGLTRATFALLQGDIATAWRMHPLAPLALLGGAKLALDAAGWAPAKWVRIPTAVWAVFGALFVVVYGARLAGHLGGLPDPIAPQNGWLVRALLLR